LNIFILILVSFSFSQSENCVASDSQPMDSRSIYSIGDTLSVEDQSTIYDVCNGNGDYQTGDSFSFIDLNGSQNGGDYKITLISMNATW
jgi:hypothetical protein